MKNFLVCMSIALVPGAVHSETLSTLDLSDDTFDDGVLIVDVNLYGTFGDQTVLGDGGSAEYNPVGVTGGFESTVYENYIGLRFDDTSGLLLREGGSVGSATIVSQTDTELVSAFTLDVFSSDFIGTFDVTLTQTVVLGEFNGNNIGSALIQSYEFTNNAFSTIDGAPATVDVLRMIDPSLYFDLAGIEGNDLGGAYVWDDETQVLFAADQFLPGTMIGIYSEGGIPTPSGSWEVGVDGDVDNDAFFSNDRPLSNSVVLDSDGDGTANVGADVAMALSNTFTFSEGESFTYTTTTLFGNLFIEGTGLAGSSEANPLVPANVLDDGFLFRLPAPPPDFVQDLKIWIDPEIAVGYTYTVTGAEFSSVTAPSFASVADADGYTLTVGATVVSLASGETYLFGDGVTEFMLTGIDESLALDPTNGLAFVTGVGLFDFTGDEIRILQSPIITDVGGGGGGGGGPDVIPLPAPLLLLGTGILGLGALRRRRRPDV